MRISDERARQHGEVLTPTWMVQQMLDALNKNLLLRGTVLDLCCGPGAFITAILRRRLSALPADANATAVLDALSGLHGVELLLDNVLATRTKLLAELDEQLGRLTSLVAAHVLEQAAGIFAQNVRQADALVDATLIPGDYDLIISNPPYQRSIAKPGTRNQSKALPLYNRFYDLARQLRPQQMCFIMPAKWYTGGWNLDRWRVDVLGEGRIDLLHDYRDSAPIFEGTEVNGGICWLRWNAEHVGDARVVRHDRTGAQISDVVRSLLEPGADFFVRDERALSILRKTGSFDLNEQTSFTGIVSGTTPFGFASNHLNYAQQGDHAHDVKLFYIKEREYWVRREQVQRRLALVDQWKVFLPLSHNQHSDQIIGTPHIYGPGSVCTHSYLAIGGFVSEAAAQNCVAYMRTRLFRFLVGQLKISPIATRQAYRLVPAQDWDVAWTDELLYAKYGLSRREVDLIESTISPFELTDGIKSDRI